MPRKPRFDAPGTWHHVMNRGIARRTLFETREDIRFFLSRVAEAVRAEQIELHAFAVLTTHFHLLVRSLLGELSAVMQHTQNEYARWFNRGRHRDGTLHRGRFLSKPVETLAYREMLVSYIDQNPVSAGLVRSPEAYPHGSAYWYARQRGAVWLERSWVEGRVRARDGSEGYQPTMYRETFGGSPDDGRFALVEARIRRTGRQPDPLDYLLDAAVGPMRDWMRRKAELADGTEVGLPVCTPAAVDAAVELAQAVRGDWQLRFRRTSVSAWPQVRVVLARELCGATLASAGARVGLSANGASQIEQRHKLMVVHDDAYALELAALAKAALQACHGPRCRNAEYGARAILHA